MKHHALACFAALVWSAAFAAAQNRAVTVEVDAREAPRKIFHARLSIPAQPGPMTLLYPKWIPGEHGPTGPITDVAGLKLAAAGKAIPWKRDPVEMYALHCDVPAGADKIDVTLDYLSPAETGGFSSGSSATARLALISWNQMLLYPAGVSADSIQYAASLRLPSGWKYATSLGLAQETPDALAFAPVSLTTLVDSPVLAGAHFRVVTLGTEAMAHRINIAADSEAALALSPELVTSYKSLVAETGALFGARHYRHYDFLVTLSDHTAHFGLEHHESSDDRVPERSLIDDARRRLMAGLLPHEMTHSWNGKYRRPAGLAPGSFDQPMRGDLLWVYEGLTQYLGQVLTARSSLLTPDQYRESLALTAAGMDVQKGRAWRPLADTAVAAQLLYGARSDWASWRRGVDFYPESELLWLEADALIRQQSRGSKSLDDFCRLFHGGESGPPKVVPYRFEDVVAALNQVAPHDWKTFWTTRLASTRPGAPLGGIAASGWKLAYREEPGEMEKALEEAGKAVDMRFSLGFMVQEGGAIPDVIADSPAARAGIGPGMKLVAVNERRYGPDILRDALKASKSRPLELLVENGEFLKSYRLDYSGPERYPYLERDSSKPDLLSQIIKPLAARAR